MTVLVVGASGATGRLLLEQLLLQGEELKVIVRSKATLPSSLISHERVQITEANILELSDTELLDQVRGCCAVASCLGHTLSLKGMFGHPRRLVKDAVQRLCLAIEQSGPAERVKFVLMNTTGNQDKSAGEKISLAQSMVIGLLRGLLPPHADNEEAAAYLQSRYSGHVEAIEWCAVRPDGLIDLPVVTDYNIYRSPTRSAIFDAGKTSRINVAHFMSRLILNDTLWSEWKSQMPVIYNA